MQGRTQRRFYEAAGGGDEAARKFRTEAICLRDGATTVNFRSAVKHERGAPQGPAE